MEEFILFGLTYLFVFIIYQIFVISPAKNRKKKNKICKEENKEDNKEECT